SFPKNSILSTIYGSPVYRLVFGKGWRHTRRHTFRKHTWTQTCITACGVMMGRRLQQCMSNERSTSPVGIPDRVHTRRTRG
uniref:Uncharacterized protein n=1 Tax=Anopheles quadriannulatus TaxID=34691 RepID=A0A182XRP7_ANOQN